MRFSIPSIFSGTLGAMVQRAIGGVNALVATIWPYAYGSTFQSWTGYAADTATLIFSAASNVNGAIVWRASWASRRAGSTGTQICSFVAKATAPTTVVDGVVVCGVDNMSYADDTVAAQEQGCSAGKLDTPVVLPAGLALYYFNHGAEADAALKSVHYTLL